MLVLHFRGVNNELSRCGYSKKDQEAIFNEQLEDICKKTRWYLDNLPTMREYRVYWKKYTKDRQFVPTMPK